MPSAGVTPRPHGLQQPERLGRLDTERQPRGRSSIGPADGGAETLELLSGAPLAALELVHPPAADGQNHRPRHVDLAQAVCLSQEGCISAGRFFHQPRMRGGLDCA